MNYLLFNKHSLRSYNCNWANLRNRFFDFIQSDKDNLYYFQHDANDNLTYLDISEYAGIIDFSNMIGVRPNVEIVEKLLYEIAVKGIDCIIGLNIPYSTTSSNYLKDYDKACIEVAPLKLHDLLTIATYKGVRVCHFVDDCLELLSANIKTTKFYSTDEIKNCTYMPFIQYGAFYNDIHSKLKVRHVKQTELTAGLKYFEFSKSEERKKIHERIIKLDALNDSRFNLYYNTGNGADNKKLLRKNAWDTEIACSYFTIMTPNQNDKYLSIIRFLEALSVDCIPLRPLWVRSFQTAISKWPDILEFYKRNAEYLNTDITDLPSTLNRRLEQYNRMIAELDTLPTIQNFRSNEYYDNYRKQFLDITKGDR